MPFLNRFLSEEAGGSGTFRVCSCQAMMLSSVEILSYLILSPTIYIRSPSGQGQAG